MRKPYSSRPLALLLAGLLVVAASLCVSFVGSTADTRVMAALPDGTGMTRCDPDPKHLWNRLHLAIHIRQMVPDGEREPPQYAAQTFDPNDLDPFFWYRHDPHYREHPYLLSGPAYREALALLDEFMDKQGERLVKVALKRALLQRELWTLFDWRLETRARLVEVVGRNQEIGPEQMTRRRCRSSEEEGLRVAIGPHISSLSWTNRMSERPIGNVHPSWTQDRWLFKSAQISRTFGRPSGDRNGTSWRTS